MQLELQVPLGLLDPQDPVEVKELLDLPVIQDIRVTPGIQDILVQLAPLNYQSIILYS